MEAIETTAKFDEKGILKISDFPFLKNRKVKVLILFPEKENEDWFELSKEKLSQSYSENEPEYLLSMINEPNQSYGDEGR
jgi:hypothetical protein